MKRVFSLILFLLMLAVLLPAGEAFASEKIDTVAISVFEPTEGKHPDYYPQLPSDAHYSVYQIAWYEYDGGDLGEIIQASNTFSYPAQVALYISLKPDSGYAYTPYTTNLQITVNGKHGAFDTRISSAGILYFYYSFTVKSSLALISSAAMTITAPVAGAKPDYSPVLKGNSYFSDNYNSGIYKNNVCWYDKTDKTFLTPDEDTFKDGHQYNVRINLTARDGFTFVDNCAGSINGRNIDAFYNYPNGMIGSDKPMGGFEYTFPALPRKIFTVTLNPNGGSVSPTVKTVTYGQQYGALPTPTRTGYLFSGWWTAKDTGGKQVIASTVCHAAGDYSLFARWTGKTLIITLDPNGGIDGPSTKNVTYGKAYGTLPTPTRTGYTFAGWWTAKSGGKQVTATTICYASGDYTLYGRWTPKSYTVTLNPNGGSVSPTTKTVTYGKAYGTLPTPMRTGYTFVGWWTAKDSGGKKVTATTICYASGNYTLYARWTVGKTYTVTLNPNGGSVSPTTKTVTYGQAYGTMPTPTRSGYTFAGWWTAKTGGKKVTATTVCYASGNYTLYARWTPKTFTVTLNPNGGSVTPTTKTVTYGKAYGTMPTPTRTGYAFDGWYTAKTGGKKVTASTVCYASGNYTLYARWVN